MSDHETNLKLAAKAEKAIKKIAAKEAKAVSKAHDKATADRLELIKSLAPEVAALLSTPAPDPTEVGEL